jgi:hypothetical protein
MTDAFGCRQCGVPLLLHDDTAHSYTAPTMIQVLTRKLMRQEPDRDRTNGPHRGNES